MESEQNLFGVSLNRWRLEDQADLFDVSVSSIHKWIAEGYPSKSSLKEMIAWVRANRPLSNDKSLSDARRQKIEIETELRRLELLIKQGELIPRGEVSSLFTDRIMVIRSGLTNFHRVLPPKLTGRDPSEFGRIIKKEANALLERYSRRSGVLRGGK